MVLAKVVHRYGFRRFKIASATPLNANSPYTFDTFVTCATNDLAYSAAKSFAEGQETHRLLFIYGVSSTGKTHLLRAIEHLLSHESTIKVRLITAEHFANVMRDYENRENLKAFRHGLGKIDALLIDDIQFLQTRRFAQGEFLHTLNTFCALGKRIAVTSTIDLQELTFSESLREILASGVTVEIEPPDEEVKNEILEKYAAQLDFIVPHEIIETLANREFAVGQMLGSLNTLIAHCRLNGEGLTLELLEKLVKTQSTKWEVGKICWVVAKHFRLRPDRLKHKSKSAFYSELRQIVCYLANEADIPFSEIGKELNQHHTAVFHSVKKIREKRQSDTALDELLIALAEQVDNR